MKPVSGGYADGNGIRLHHQIYGEGEPLVLIHGGLTTIDEMQGWVQPLAKIRQVIAVEMHRPRPHGRHGSSENLERFIEQYYIRQRLHSAPGYSSLGVFERQTENPNSAADFRSATMRFFQA